MRNPSVYCLSANLAPKQFSHLGDDWFYDVSVDVGQPKVPALVLVGEALMVDSKQVHDGGVKVVHMNAILGDILRVFVGMSMRITWLGSTSDHPE